MTRSQFGQPPQIEAVTTSTKLATLTVGGNDLRYTASLYAACIPPWVSRVPLEADRHRLATEPSRNADRLQTPPMPSFTWSARCGGGHHKQ